MMISPSVFRKGNLDDALLVWLSQSEFTKDLDHKDAEKLFSASNVRSLIEKGVSDDCYLHFIRIVIGYKNKISNQKIDDQKPESTFDENVNWRFDEALIEGCKGKQKSINLLTQYLSDLFLNAGGWVEGVIDSQQKSGLTQVLKSKGGPYCTSIERIIANEILPVDQFSDFVDRLLLKIRKEISVAIEAYEKFDYCFEKLKKTNISLNLLSLAKSKDSLAPTIYSDIVISKCRQFIGELPLANETTLYNKLLKKIAFIFDDLAEEIALDAAANDSITLADDGLSEIEDISHAIRGIPKGKFISDIFVDYESASNTLKKLNAEKMEFFFYRALDMSTLHHQKDLAWILSSINESQVSSRQMELDIIKAAVKLEQNNSNFMKGDSLGTQLACHNIFETFDLDYERTQILIDSECMHGRIHNLVINQTNNYSEEDLYKLLIQFKSIASKQFTESECLSDKVGVVKDLLEISKVLASEYIYPKILKMEDSPLLASQLVDIIKIGLRTNNITQAEFDLIAKYDLSKLERLRDEELNFALAGKPDFNEIYIAKCLEAKVKSSAVGSDQKSTPKKHFIL